MVCIIFLEHYGSALISLRVAGAPPICCMSGIAISPSAFSSIICVIALVELQCVIY